MSLLAALLHTETPLTAAELARRVEGYPDEKPSFRRAFERDKDDLRRLGVPLELSKRETRDGPVDAYRVRTDDYYLHDLGLEPDETVALAMALRVIRLEGSTADDARWKLGGADAGVDAPDELAAIAMGPAVADVHAAIRDAMTVEFTYRHEQRTVEPWRLQFRRGNWYLTGYDVSRDDERRFRLDRVEGGVHRLDRPATAVRAPGEDERKPWEFGGDDDAPPVVARVSVDLAHAGWVRHQLGADAVVAERPDGSIDVELEVSNNDGFRSFVLGMLDGAEVLEPPELRADIIGWLEGLVP